MIIKIRHNKTEGTYTLTIDDIETKPMTDDQLYEVNRAIAAAIASAPTLYMDIID